MNPPSALLMLACALLCQFSNGFTTCPSTASPSCRGIRLGFHSENNYNQIVRTIGSSGTMNNVVDINTSSTSLHAEKKNNVLAEYEERGKYLFAIVMFAIIWSFTIPPEIRRQHICFSRNCRLDNTGKFCYDCVSFGEYADQIAEYYKGGGGIKFDFSIEGRE